VADPRQEQSTFGHYGEVERVSGNWAAAFFTSSLLYALIGVAVLIVASFTKQMINEPEPVEVKFVEKVVKPAVAPPKPEPPTVEARPRPQAPAAAAAVPRHMKVRRLDAPPPPKVLEAPKEMPLEAPAEADPSFDQGVAVYGEPGDGDPAGLEGGFGDASGDMVGIFEGLPKGAIAPKPRRQNKKPEYPPSALADKITGVVVVKCVVRADGILDEVTIEKGEEPFVTFVEKELKKWRYEPGQYQGRAISVRHTIEIRFRLTA
jgi:TonB family protein